MKAEATTFFFHGKAFSKHDLELLCAKSHQKRLKPGKKKFFHLFWNGYLFQQQLKFKLRVSICKPKEVFLEKKFMEASAIATLDFFKLKPGHSALLCLPVKFIAGKMMIARAFVGGLNLIVTKPTSVPKINNFQKIDFCAMVPSQVAGILETKNGIE